VSGFLLDTNVLSELVRAQLLSRRSRRGSPHRPLAHCSLASWVSARSAKGSCWGHRGSGERSL